MWSILTCEYPPECGGVGDYTAQVAGALAAAGDEVTVFCPPSPSSAFSAQPGVNVVVLPDRYGGESRREIDERLNGRRSTLLLQYVPTAFGMRGANIPLCRWLEDRASRDAGDIRVMFHEPYFEFTWEPLHQNVLSFAQREMAKSLLRASTHVYVSTDAWGRYLRPYGPRSDWSPITLPIPSSIPKCDRAAAAAERRQKLVSSSLGRLVGHFGTYGSHIAPMLQSALIGLLSDDPDVSAICMGSGSDRFVLSLIQDVPSLAGRVHATGRTSAPETAVAIAACDLLLQPYNDGVTTRRTSVMA